MGLLTNNVKPASFIINAKSSYTTSWEALLSPPWAQ
jgi:hypothetical protein